jgi:Fe-S cluster assembly ATP-binding protein
MLKIKNITAVSESQPLLTDISLEINPGEIHAVMGPKHSGKTALAHVISGHPSIQLTDGNIIWKRKNLKSLDSNDIANLGIFVSFQVPPEFDSMTNWELVKSVFVGNDAADLQVKYTKCCELLDLGAEHGDRCPNITGVTLSQSKRNEIVHMLLKNPELIVLDEIEEGLTDKEIVLVGVILKDFLNQTKKSSLVITHNQTLLKLLNPTHVHVMVAGEIKLSGNTELYTRIIEDGYSEFS